MSRLQIPQASKQFSKFFFKKWANPGPFYVLFSFFSHYNLNTNLKKRRWCAWDSNLGPQDGRRRQNHGAMLATLAVQ